MCGRSHRGSRFTGIVSTQARHSMMYSETSETLASAPIEAGRGVSSRRSVSHDARTGCYPKPRSRPRVRCSNGRTALRGQWGRDGPRAGGTDCPSRRGHTRPWSRGSRWPKCRGDRRRSRGMRRTRRARRPELSDTIVGRAVRRCGRSTRATRDPQDRVASMASRRARSKPNCSMPIRRAAVQPCRRDPGIQQQNHTKGGGLWIMRIERMNQGEPIGTISAGRVNPRGASRLMENATAKAARGEASGCSSLALQLSLPVHKHRISTRRVTKPRAEPSPFSVHQHHPRTLSGCP